MASTLNSAVLKGGVKYTHYFNGRLLTAEDLRVDQQALLSRSSLIAQAVGEGVLEGLWVELVQGSSPPEVTLSAGAGINREGQPLALAQAAQVTLVRDSSTSSSTSAGAFGACEPPQDTVVPTGTGFYLLVASPGSTYEGRAPGVAGSSGVASQCQSRYVVEGINLRLVSLEGIADSERVPEDVAETFAELTSDVETATSDSGASRLRNLMASLCLGVTGWLRWGEDLYEDLQEGQTQDAHDVLGVLREAGTLEDCDLPLALIFWASSGVVFIDNLAVRRLPTRVAGQEGLTAALASRQRTAREAQMLQFQAHLEDVIAAVSGSDDVPSVQDWFRYLPAAGLLPLDQIGLSFFGDAVKGEPVVLEAQQWRALLDMAPDFEPIDVEQGLPIYVYRLRENIDAVLDETASPWALFASAALAEKCPVPVSIEKGEDSLTVLDLRSLYRETSDIYQELQIFIPAGLGTTASTDQGGSGGRVARPPSLKAAGKAPPRSRSKRGSQRVVSGKAAGVKAGAKTSVPSNWDWVGEVESPQVYYQEPQVDVPTLTDRDHLGLHAIGRVVACADALEADVAATPPPQPGALGQLTTLANVQRHFTRAYSELIIPYDPYERYNAGFSQMIEDVYDYLTRTQEASGIDGLENAISDWDLLSAVETQHAINARLRVFMETTPVGQITLEITGVSPEDPEPLQMVAVSCTLTVGQGAGDTYDLSAEVQAPADEEEWNDSLSIKTTSGVTITSSYVSSDGTLDFVVWLEVPRDAEGTDVTLTVTARSRTSPQTIYASVSTDIVIAGEASTDPELLLVYEGDREQTPAIEVAGSGEPLQFTVVGTVTVAQPAVIYLTATLEPAGTYEFSLQIGTGELNSPTSGWAGRVLPTKVDPELDITEQVVAVLLYPQNSTAGLSTPEVPISVTVTDSADPSRTGTWEGLLAWAPD